MAELEHSVSSYQLRPETQKSQRVISEYGARSRSRPVSTNGVGDYGRGGQTYGQPELKQSKSTVNQTMIQYNNNQLDISALSDQQNMGNQSMADFSRSQIQWGVEGYYAPTNDWYFHRPRTFWAKGKKENIIEWEAKRKKDLPAPNLYKLENDWSKNTKGRFLKGDRVTLIDDILKLKKQRLPGPGSYKLPSYKIQGMPKTTTDKCQFINDAKYSAMQTPGSKYKINYDLTRPRTPAARYFADKSLTGKEPISIKPKKTKDPAPGTYNVEDCYRKTQWGNSVYSIGKCKITNYVDIAVKKKKFVPGIGTYKELDKGYQALSKPPTSLRRYR
ncbi:UNKNOWN [Stylonychia lemnae]|uniref:Uncharacterized protein n=1 Tax=Stylonychia lemnae TaxID=5949 RepID=A0A078AM05_STYLE|nr:UNKNOWN [Stylonychia lemnae]|eukprot:CDW83400.1 UNKNOWN [Stylonychia lemnae]